MILLACALLQDESNLYRLPAGTTWTFQVDDGGKAGKMILKVLEDKDGKVTIETQEFKDAAAAEPSKVAKLLWSTDDGCLMWSSVRDDKTRPLWRIYKFGSKKDETWAAGGESRTAEAANLGVEEVTVPAGTYKDAIHTRVKVDETENLEFYLVPKVGLVKFVRNDGDRKIVMELKEFTAGK